MKKSLFVMPLALLYAALLVGCKDDDTKDDDTKDDDTKDIQADTEPAPTEDNFDACKDNKDNDENGKVDCEDSGCEAFCCEAPYCAYDFKDEISDEADPEAIGALVAGLFNDGLSNTSGDDHYKVACTWYGALKMAHHLDDETLTADLTHKFNYYIDKGVFDDTLEGAGHVDENVFGIVPLEIYMTNEDELMLETGLALANHQFENKDHPDQKRMAIDDMFMVIGLQVQAYRATEDDKYLDFAAERMTLYLDELQNDDGCFYQLQEAGIEWGRGNGWFAAGMAEILQELDEDHEFYDDIFEGYQKMMSGLLAYQIKKGNDKGLWYQILDLESDDNWAETSGSAMFVYSMIVGVRNGWLNPETYEEAVLNGWHAIVENLKDEEGELDGELRGISNWAYWNEERGEPEEYYLRRKPLRAPGDFHGQAPVLWAAEALLR